MTLFGWHRIEEFMKYYKMADSSLRYLFESDVLNKEITKRAVERIPFHVLKDNELDYYSDNNALFELESKDGRTFLYINYVGDVGVGEFEVIKLKEVKEEIEMIVNYKDLIDEKIKLLKHRLGEINENVSLRETWQLKINQEIKEYKSQKEKIMKEINELNSVREDLK